MSCNEHTKKVKSLTKSIQPRKYGFGFIYRLIKDGECSYVGQTVDLKSRLYHHLSAGKTFDSVEVFQCEIENLNNVEADLIVKLKPVLNRSIPKCDAFVRVTTVRDDICALIMKEGIKPDYTESGGNAIKYVTSKKRDKILELASRIILKAESLTGE